MLLTACALITEPDISDSDVILIAPTHNLKTEIATHTFWWDYVQDATNYNLIIVSPLWDSVITLVADTNLTTNKFTMTLPPGDYDWAVSASNYSSATDYYINHLKIDTMLSLNGQKVRLLSPSDNRATNNTKNLFQWEIMTIADAYTIEIKENDWQGTSVAYERGIVEDTASIELDEGIYAWGVIAYNNTSSTYPSVRQITIDITPPGVPVITKPEFQGDTLLNNNALITWEHPETSLSAISDSVFIATDSSDFFSNLIEINVVNTNEYKLSGYDAGKYYVRLRSIDAAGNTGEISAIKGFYIDEE